MSASSPAKTNFTVSFHKMTELFALLTAKTTYLHNAQCDIIKREAHAKLLLAEDYLSVYCNCYLPIFFKIMIYYFITLYLMCLYSSLVLEILMCETCDVSTVATSNAYLFLFLICFARS